jgi:hypothetical protein
VDWVFFKAYGKNEGQRIQCQTGVLGAGCTYSMQYYQQQGRCDKTPKVGDQIFFRYTGSTSGADHTGIVVEVNASQIVTVEGNSGDQVKKNTYARSNGTIIGYGHPLYSETDTEEAKPAPPPAPAAEPTTGTFALGSTVAFKPSAERYNPNSALIPDWVKTSCIMLFIENFLLCCGLVNYYYIKWRLILYIFFIFFCPTIILH